MNQLLHQAIVSGDSNITISVSAGDLRSIITEMVASERRRIDEAIARHRELPTLTRKQAAEMIGVSTKTLLNWAKEQYLVPVKIGTKVLYRPSDIDEILLKRKAM